MSMPKIFSEDMVGAPVLNGVAGSLISLLDACLVYGFGLKSADSVTVSGGIATMNFSSGHSFRAHSIALVAGATPSVINGEQRILSTTTTTATFATSAPDGTATGAITAKVAPLGWTKVFTGTNKAVYKASAPEASGAFLRVDDTGVSGGANTARVRMYEVMTDVDTGINPAPADGRVVGGGLYWIKAWSSSANSVRWALVGDDRTFYFAPMPYSQIASSATVSGVWGFGDLISYRSGDPYPGFLTGDSVEFNGNANATLGYAAGDGDSSTQLMRPVSGIGNSVPAARRALTGSGSSGADSAMGRYPCPANNGLLLTQITLGQMPMSTNGPRGVVPGALYVPQTGTNSGQFPRGSIIDGTGAFVGKKIYSIPTTTAISDSSDDRAFFFDLTGPWRE
ncbi:hypothetical protein [Comamonas antarctica]|uniref:hypothetical protein n=1 Tax=Comamonas antarctica TaxID=2743470 RepID=UPI0028E585D8|nr:hypothetical protein [Comamonas antarctica]